MITESPWVRIARDAAREWFRDNPGGDLDHFMAWAERYEVEQVLAAGFDWHPGDDVTEQAQDALDAAWAGLMAARESEAACRARRAAARRLGPVRTGLWWERADGAA